jgi:hypothetical protein
VVRALYASGKVFEVNKSGEIIKCPIKKTVFREQAIRVWNWPHLDDKAHCCLGNGVSPMKWPSFRVPPVVI